MNIPRPLHYLFLISFMAALWTPLIVFSTTPKQEISTAENRTLATKPDLELKTISEYPQAFASYYDDHFGLREPLLKTHTYARYAMLNISSTNSVIVGHDGWLFRTGHLILDDIRNTWSFSEDELRHWGNILTMKQAWVEEQGAQYIFMIVPSKHLIYPEHLPSAFQPVHHESRTDQLVNYLQKHTKVSVLDLRKALLAEKNRLRPYHKTDTHWNDYGAYIGYQETMKHLQSKLRDFPSVYLTKRDFTMVTEPSGNLARMMNLQDRIQEQAPKTTTWQPTCLYNSTLEGEQNDDTRNQNWFATTCETGKYRALMFRDSFSLAMMQYLSETFAYIYYIPHSPVRMENLKKIVLEERPDVVIEQRASRWLRTPEG